jgi:DNA-3-methyladenine glycosylase
MNRILPKDFYLHSDVCAIARQLIGKKITVSMDNKQTQAIITETEAYAGIDDKASHAYNNKRTTRTETMYQEGGIAYVYLCYGMHYMLNAVTNTENHPHAVLIRSVFPLCSDKSINIKQMLQSGKGPGRTTKFLGIDMTFNTMSLQCKKLHISESDIFIEPDMIQVSPRIGIDYAGEDSLLPYRFHIDENKNPEIFQIIIQHTQNYE